MTISNALNGTPKTRLGRSFAILGPAAALGIAGCGAWPAQSSAPLAKDGEPIGVKLGDHMMMRMVGTRNFPGTVDLYLHRNGEAPRVRPVFCFERRAFTGSRLARSGCEGAFFLESITNLALQRHLSSRPLPVAGPDQRLVLDITDDLRRSGIFVLESPWKSHILRLETAQSLRDRDPALYARLMDEPPRGSALSVVSPEELLADRGLRVEASPGLFSSAPQGAEGG